MIKVFDSSAFLNRFFFNDIENVITTNSVLNEIKNREQKQQIENLIQNRKISIQDPDKNILIQLKCKAPKQLSKTDLEVIALAKELNAELHTDDFMMRKFAKDMHIKINAVAYDIKKDFSLDSVYEKIAPKKEELLQIKKVSKEIINTLNKTAKKEKIPVKKIVLAGSSARGTFISNKKDLDIFILFDLKMSIDEIKNYNIKLLEKSYPNNTFVEEYGEHPYLQTELFGHSIEFVPGFLIKDISERKSSVDRTPLHLKYLNKNLNNEMKKQIIILKQFLKNNLLYGADQEHNGFSGYLTELLILKYKTFENVLKNFEDLEKNKYIYINKFKILKKFDDYLIFIDPVDSTRNVASAVSKRNWQIFSNISKQYLNNPGNEFFFGNIYKNDLPKDIICFSLTINGKTPDSNWGITKGIAKRLANELNSKHYNIEHYSGIASENKGLIFIESKLNDTLRGPTINDQKNAKAFRAKHKNAYVKDNRLYCDIIQTKANLINDVKKILKSTFKDIKLVEFNALDLKAIDIKRIKKDFL